MPDTIRTTINRKTIHEDQRVYKVGDIVMIKNPLENLEVILRTKEKITISCIGQIPESGRSRRITEAFPIQRILTYIKSDKMIYRLEGISLNWTSEEFVSADTMTRVTEIDQELAEINKQLSPKKTPRKTSLNTVSIDSNGSTLSLSALKFIHDIANYKL